MRSKMDYRDRFEATMKHQVVDRVPFDLAGTSLTGIDHPRSIERLRQILGYSGAYDGGYHRFDDRILKYFDIDFRRVGGIIEPERSMISRKTGNEYTDCWGVTRVFTGLYWDIKKSPLRGASIEDLDTFPWPRIDDIDLHRIDRFRNEARDLNTRTNYVVCAEHPVYGVLELGCWMCGFDEFLLKMALEPEFVIEFFDRILDYQKKVIELYYGALGEYIHLTTSGDDFGTQTGPFISPDMFREMIKPYYKERIAYTKEFTKAYYFHHTCGSVFPLIPDLIDAGVDILNPIQPGAKDMEPAKLKTAYGDKIVFWGGIDTQHILPDGSTDDVEKEVTRILTAMSDHGGYVLSPAHNIQPDVPMENVVAIYETGKRFFAGRP